MSGTEALITVAICVLISISIAGFAIVAARPRS